MTTTHANCDHDATKADRAACRKARAERYALAHNLRIFLDADTRYGDWLLKGARRFDITEGDAMNIPTDDRFSLALSLLDYFSPLRDEAFLARRRENGYTITTDPRTIRSIILRSFS